MRVAQAMPTTEESPSRLCTGCIQPKPMTDEFYYKQEGGLYGFMRRCKACVRQHQIDYRNSLPKAAYSPPRRKGRPPRIPMTDTMDFDLSTDQDVRDAVAVGGMNYNEISIRLGISHQAVQQCEVRALGKLRRHCEIRGISFNDLFQEMRRF